MSAGDWIVLALLGLAAALGLRRLCRRESGCGDCARCWRNCSKKERE